MRNIIAMMTYGVCLLLLRPDFLGNFKGVNGAGHLSDKVKQNKLSQPVA